MTVLRGDAPQPSAHIDVGPLFGRRFEQGTMSEAGGGQETIRNLLDAPLLMLTVVVELAAVGDLLLQPADAFLQLEEVGR